MKTMTEKEWNPQHTLNPNLELNLTTQNWNDYIEKQERLAYYNRNKLYGKLVLLQYKNRKRREKAKQKEDTISKVLETPESQMRLFGVFDLHSITYFDKLEDIKSYIAENNIAKEKTFILDYIGYYAGKCDVIRESCADKKIKFLTAIDELGYAELNIERSIRENETIWEYYEGELSDMHDAFRRRGLHFKNDIYQKQEEDVELLRKYYKEKFRKEETI